MSQKFELPKPTMMELKHVSTNKEHHGEALVLAIDLKFKWVTNNIALNMLDGGGMREALFAALPPGTKAPVKVEDDDGQAEMDMPVSDLPFVRMPRVGYPLKTDYEFTGYKLVRDYGRGGDADQVLSLCKLKDFKITPIEGGSVCIEFGVRSAADVTGEMAGSWSEAAQENVEISLFAPVKAEGPVIDASNGSGAPGTNGASGETPALNGETNGAKAGTKAPVDATDAFVASQPEGGTPPVTH
jgi:hypothetical protein